MTMILSWLKKRQILQKRLLINFGASLAAFEI